MILNRIKTSDKTVPIATFLSYLYPQHLKNLNILDAHTDEGPSKCCQKSHEHSKFYRD